MAWQHLLAVVDRMSPQAKAKAKAKARAKARTGKAMENGNSGIITVSENLYRQCGTFFVQKMKDGKCIRKSFGGDRAAAEKFLKSLLARQATKANDQSKKPRPGSAGPALGKKQDCCC